MTGQIMVLTVAHLAAQTSADGALGGTIGYILNYGVLGAVALALAFRWLVPKGAVEDAREQGRADVIAERDLLIARAGQLETKLEAQQRRDQEELVPLLVSFVRATDTLIPILQGIVRNGPPPSEHGRGGG